MLILGIESSCDDTSVALLDCSKNGHVIISEKTASQIDLHKKYGGVVPEIAGRAHAEKIVPLIEAILERQPKPDAIAVTAGPGLITGLLVGVEAARTLSYALNIPLIGVNHIEGHIYSTLIGLSSREASRRRGISVRSTDERTEILRFAQNDNDKITFPALCLIVSGGHTELIFIKKQGSYKIIGATVDDAAGECFDKVAKLVGLPYPGGPQISKLAENGNANAIKFPRPMLTDKNYSFSFAGLKTSALYWLRDNRIVIPTTHSLRSVQAPEESLSQSTNGQRSLVGASLTRDDKREVTRNDFCASVEQAIVDVLVAKTVRAAEQYKPKTIILAGGVSANKKLRETLEHEIKKQFPTINIQYPQLKYCMDNAAMIAVAGYYHALKKDFTDWKKIKADPNWELA